MTTFERIHEERIVGKLIAVDRLILKGHLTSLMPDGAFARFLWMQGVLLKDFGRYAEEATAAIKANAERIAREAGRPFEYLESAHTAARGCSKEDHARAIADRDGITEGLVVVFRALEPCMTFGVRGNGKTRRLEVTRRPSKCLSYYFYYVDRELGFMHVRLQSWFPFPIQVYVNGREYLYKQLNHRYVAYRRHDNAILSVEDLGLTQRLAEKFIRRNWVSTLDAFARSVNPWLPEIMKAGFGGYYWVVDQCEVATDVMFKDRSVLEAILPDLFEAGTLTFSGEDVLRFLGRKLSPALKAEVTSDHKHRPEGRRVKHRVGKNSIKMYDKHSVLRVETTINHPRDFKVLNVEETDQGIVRRWVPMSKNVSNLRRYFQVASAANERYLDAMANVVPRGEAVRALDDLCQSHVVEGRRIAKLAPLGPQDTELFRAALRGEHLVHGLRNRNIRDALFPSDTSKIDTDEARRQCARVSRLISKLRGHGLLAKVQGCHLYRVTPKGQRLMAASLQVRDKDFPAAFRAAA
jgi:hypothetical protein